LLLLKQASQGVWDCVMIQCGCCPAAVMCRRFTQAVVAELCKKRPLAANRNTNEQYTGLEKHFKVCAW
jgi:hypothetical protein